MLRRLCWLAASIPAIATGCGSESTPGEANPGASAAKSSATVGGNGAATDTGKIAILIPNAAGTTGANSGKVAEQTPDGLMSITSAQAKAILADPSTSCAGWAEEPESAASSLQFIVDVSGSMNSTTDATGGYTKWAVTQQSLHKAIGELPGALPVGLTFFPNMQLSAAYTARPVSACVNTAGDVPIASLSDGQRALLTRAVDSMRANPKAATPTHDAYTVALANIRGFTGPGQKYLVLITDGQPTQSLGCVGTGMTSSPEPTDPVVAAIAAARKNDQVKTFIVGSPGSEKNVSTNADSRDWLSAAARAGGTDTPGCSDQGPHYCHFDLSTAEDFGTALSDALGTIGKTVVSCDYGVPSVDPGKTIDTNLVNMIYDDGSGDYSLVLPSSLTACEKGWNFTDTSLSGLRVCAQTCALLQSNPHAKISLVFGCTQAQIQSPIL